MKVCLVYKSGGQWDDYYKSLVKILHSTDNNTKAKEAAEQYIKECYAKKELIVKLYNEYSDKLQEWYDKNPSPEDGRERMAWVDKNDKYEEELAKELFTEANLSYDSNQLAYLAYEIRIEEYTYEEQEVEEIK